MVEVLQFPFRAAFEKARELVSDPLDAAAATRFRDEQFAVLRRNTPSVMAANFGNAFALLATLSDTPLALEGAVWTASVAVVCGFLYLRARRRPGPRRPGAQPMATGRRAVFNALILGLLWAAPPILFFPAARPGAQLMIVALTAGMLFGGAFALARTPLAAAAFALPIALSSATTLLLGADADHARLAIVLCIYVAVLGRCVFSEADRFKAQILAQVAAEHLARTDPLTGLPNRRAFIDAMERELARKRRHGGSFLLLCVDFDRFKAINDELGHPAGDELLSQAAQRMRAAVRGADFVGRLGGDEFAVIATEIGSPETARLVAARIASCFEAPFTIAGRPVRCAVSVGGALGPRHGDDQQALFKSADVALYQAKAHGGGLCLFEPEADAEPAAHAMPA